MKNLYPLKKWLSCHAEFISASKIEILKQVQNDIILRGYKNLINCIFIIFLTFLFITTNSMGLANQNPGQEYRSPLLKDVQTLDPVYISDPYSYEVASQIYNGLVTYRPVVKNKKETLLDIIPDLAEKWSISDDRCTYTFQLRKGIKFHNGRMLESRDVKKSFERIIDPRNESAGSWTLQFLPIVGVEQFQEDCMADFPTPDLSGIQIVDNNIVKIILKKPVPYALSILAMPYYYVTPTEEIFKWWKRYGEHPVGTGPYKLQEWQKKKSLTLIKNDLYFEQNLPSIPILKYFLYPTETESFNAFKQGKLEHSLLPKNEFFNVINDPEWNKIGEYKLLEKEFLNDREKSFILKAPLSSIIEYISMDTTTFPFTEIKVRQAFNYAIDKYKLVEKRLNYQATALKGIISGEMPFLSQNNDNIPYPYNPAKAKKLLREVGWKDINLDGFIEPPKYTEDIVLWYDKNKEIQEICEAIQSDLKDIGIKIVIKEQKHPFYIQKSKGYNLSFFYANWIPDFPDLSRIFNPLFYSSEQNNTSHFIDKKVDELLEKAENTIDEPGRLELYSQAEKIIIEQAPFIFLCQPVIYKILQPYVIGQQIHPVLPNLMKLVSFS